MTPVAAGTVGMNPTEVTALATRLEEAAGELEAIGTVLGAQLRRTSWVGSDAEHARAEWNGRHTKILHQNAMALREAATRLRAEATGQVLISDAVGGAIDAGSGAHAGSGDAATQVLSGIGFGVDILEFGSGHLLRKLVAEGRASVGFLDDLWRAGNRLDWAGKLLGRVEIVFDLGQVPGMVKEGDWTGIGFTAAGIALTAGGIVTTGGVSLVLAGAAFALSQPCVQSFVTDAVAGAATFISDAVDNTFTGPLAPAHVVDTVVDVSEAAADFAGDAIEQGTRLFHSLFD